MQGLSRTDRSIVDHLLARPQATAQEVASRLALPQSTAVSALNRLTGKGIVVRGEPIVYGRGRPSVPFQLRLPGAVLVIEIDGSQMAACLLDSHANVLAEQSVGVIYLKNLKDALTFGRQLLASLLIEANVPRSSLVFAVLAVNARRLPDGPVSSSVLPWASSQMAERFAQALGVRAFMVPHGGLQAEWQHLPEPWPDSMLYLRAGDGVSCHSIVRGQTSHGHNRLAGELGHITAEPGGSLCGCGKRGCLETICSGAAIVKALLAAGQGQRTRLDLPLLAASPTRSAIEHIWQVWLGRDKVVRQAMLPILERLAWGLSMAINLYDPDLVRAGGYVLEGHDAWIEQIAKRVRPHLIFGTHRKLRIESAKSSRRQQQAVAAFSALDQFLGNGKVKPMRSA